MLGMVLSIPVKYPKYTYGVCDTKKQIYRHYLFGKEGEALTPSSPLSEALLLTRIETLQKMRFINWI